MKPLERKVKEALEATGAREVVLGLSGGADSMALLLSLLETGIQVTALHCNFHLRGEESNRDENFVRDECRRLGVDLLVKGFDTESYCSERKLSTEMACRELRYAEFRKVKQERGADRIAVAHNLDDQAETVLLNLMRGSGIAGLRGMLPDTGEIIRPLLNVTREEIISYLDSLKQAYVTDSTNLESSYRRNFLRNEVIPLLETRWPQAKKSICSTAAIMASEERILSGLERNLTGEDDFRLPYSTLRQCFEPYWILRRFASKCGANASQCQEIAKALFSEDFQSGKIWNTRRGRISAERDSLEFTPVAQNGIAKEESGECPFYCRTCSFEDTDMETVAKTPLTELWTTLPPEQIEFRRAKRGDRIHPLGINGTTPVSKIMKDAKLSHAEKEKIMVASDKTSGKIVWISGLKRSALHLVQKDSKVFYHYSPML